MAAYDRLILSSNGFPINALHFPVASLSDSSSPSKPLPPAILIAPATGVPASFYIPFSQHLRSFSRCPVLVFDYQYSGKSWPGGVDPSDPEARLKALKGAPGVSIAVEWKADYEAALGWVVGRYSAERRIAVIGHSVGGHILPLLDDRLLAHVDRALFLGAMSPYVGHYADPPKNLERIMGIREKTSELGYFPGRAIGRGADLPSGVGREWFGWMRYDNYLAHDHAAKMSTYRVPTLSIAVTDDDIGDLPNQDLTADAILHLLLLSPSTRVLFDPSALSWPPVGHINAFTATHASGAEEGGIWEVMREWLVEGREVGWERGNVRDFNGGAGGRGREKKKRVEVEVKARGEEIRARL